MNPPTFMVKLRQRREVAEATMAFQFDKPAGFTFMAGQFLDMTLKNPPETDAEGNVRTFSIASAPTEDMLMVATRMRDTAFKRVLKSMPVATEVQIEGPSGTLTLHDDPARPAVFLAGGIGITPFRSMLVGAATAKLPHRLLLFYSNRRPQDAAFLEELQALARENRNYTFIGSMTEMEKSRRQWHGQTGVIDQAMLSRFLKDVHSPVYYIAGPPAMVEDLHATLTGAGIKDDHINAEEFAGY